MEGRDSVEFSKQELCRRPASLIVTEAKSENLEARQTIPQLVQDASADLSLRRANVCPKHESTHPFRCLCRIPWWSTLSVRSAMQALCTDKMTVHPPGQSGGDGETKVCSSPR